MKQKIYEIPIWDAYEIENCECALCAIEKNSDDGFIDALFTEMVMDVRLNPQLVKDYDFCHEHFEKLYRYPDKCGLAVLTNRILYSKRENLKLAVKGKSETKKASFKGLFSKDRPGGEKNNEKQCLLCTRLYSSMDNYLETLIQLWMKEERFRTLYKASKGLCLKHFNSVMLLSDELIKNEAMGSEFKSVTLESQEKNMARLQEELEWFISKFDYRFTNEPWKNSKDSLIRTIQKLIGNYNTKI
jgi:hypothetical protein